jgi:hypothetical protein
VPGDDRQVGRPSLSVRCDPSRARRTLAVVAARELDDLLQEARSNSRVAFLASALVVVAFVYGTTLLVLAAMHMR